MRILRRLYPRVADMDNVIRGILNCKSRRKALRCLYAAKDEITGRELGRRIGFSHQQAHNVLHELVAFGIVERRTMGPSHLFRLNLQSAVAAEAVRRLLAGASAKARVPSKASGEKHKICWSKALEFLGAMSRAGESGDWSTAGLAGIHCCLFAACAVLAKRTGICPAAELHQAIPALLEGEIGAAEGVPAEIKNFKAALAHKELIVHSARLYSEGEFAELKACVERYLAWTEGVYNSL